MTVGFSSRDWDPGKINYSIIIEILVINIFFTLRMGVHWPFFYFRGSSGPVLYPAISDGNKNRE